jgi:hypothetical protein
MIAREDWKYRVNATAKSCSRTFIGPGGEFKVPLTSDQAINLAKTIARGYGMTLVNPGKTAVGRKARSVVR